MGASPFVSTAEIGEKKLRPEGCRISNLQLTKEGASFDRLDYALPMPIDERAEPALKLAPVLDDLDRYELRIYGLAERTYEITIDGDSAGKVSGKDLAAGWNLANSAGPITKQAREVLRLIFEKNNAFFHRRRDVQLYTFPSWASSPDVESKRTAEL